MYKCVSFPLSNQECVLCCAYIGTHRKELGARVPFKSTFVVALFQSVHSYCQNSPASIIFVVCMSGGYQAHDL